MPVKHNFWIFLIVYGEKDASSSLETVRTEYEMTRVTAALLFFLCTDEIFETDWLFAIRDLILQ